MTDHTPSRRAFLSGGLAVALTATAGCVGTSDANGESGRTLQLSLTQWDGTLRDRFVVDLSETDPDWDEDAFEAALDGERYTTQQRTPFLSNSEDPKYTERDGTYYRLDSVVVDEARAERPILRLTEQDDADGESTSSVAATDLPDADERAVHIAHLAARARGDTGGVPWGLVQRGGYVYRRDEAIEASELLADDGPEHVTYRDTTYAVEVSRETFHEPVYRATVEPVAEDPEQMEAILRAQFVVARFSRADLSEEAKDVLERAQHDGYGESHPYSDGYETVLRGLHERAFLDGDVENDGGVKDDGRQLLRYEDRYYDYSLRFTSATDG